jgi:DNA-binding Lrp family transcriptional regulator
MNKIRPPAFALDERDRAILRLLQQDGRLTNLELAQRINLSPSACLRRVKLLEDSGLVARYVLLLDEDQAGLPGTAFVLVTLDQQGRAALDAFEAAIHNHPEITECCLLAGAADYMVRVVYADAADFERIHTEILTQLPGVTRVQTTLALRTVKRTTALPV